MSYTITTISHAGRDPHLRAALLAIMLAARTPEPFRSAQEEQEFAHRWLGRYLESPDTQVSVAADRKNTPIGYILVQLATLTRAEWSADMPYYETFAPHLAAYPAHLHINVAASHRGTGIGSSLLNHACTTARKAGAPGIHLVTASDAPNVTFYNANAFTEIARDTRDKIRVMLARRLV